MLRECSCQGLISKSEPQPTKTAKPQFLVVAMLLIFLTIGQVSGPNCFGQAGNRASSANTHLFFFTDHGCAPCRQVEPSIEALKQEGYPVSTHYLSSSAEMGAKFGVDRTPTVVLISNNKMVGRHAGLIDAVTLKKWFTAVGMPNGTLFDDLARKSGPVGGTKVVMQENRSAERIAKAGRDEFSTPTIHKGTDRAANLNERMAMDATVRLRVEDPRGISFATGTVIHNHQGECLVMTCGHVFRDANGKGAITAEYGFAKGQKKTAAGQLIFYDADARDIALVAIRTNEKIKPVPIAQRTETVERGNDIFSVGCDHGDDPTIRHSKIKNRASYDGAIKYDIYGRPVDGRSGGGLFNAKGELIGVCNAAAVEVDEGIYTALDTIYWQLAKVNLEHLFEPSAIVSNGRGSNSLASNQLAQTFASNPRSRAPKSRLASLNRSRDSGARTLVSNPRTPVAWNNNPREDREVVIIVRSKSDPNQAEAIMVSDPSPKLLDYLGTMKSSPEASKKQLNLANWRELN